MLCMYRHWTLSDWLSSSTSAFIIYHWCKSGENLTNTFQDIVLNSPESAVYSKLYSAMTLTFDPKL